MILRANPGLYLKVPGVRLLRWPPEPQSARPGFSSEIRGGGRARTGFPRENAVRHGAGWYVSDSQTAHSEPQSAGVGAAFGRFRTGVG